MKKIIMFLAIIIIAGSATAQNNNNAFVSKGKKAILFSFSGLGDLNADAYNGGIGGKYFISDNLALRLGVQFNYESETTPANETETENGLDGDKSSTQFGINAAAEYHLTNSRISPYVGGGASYTSFSSEQFNRIVWDKSYTGLVEKNTFEKSGVSTFQIYAIAGIEVFIVQWLSLAAEYQFGYSSESEGENKRSISLVQGSDPAYPNVTTLKNPSESSIGFRTGGALTLSIYF